MALLEEDRVRRLLRPLLRTRTVLEPVASRPAERELTGTRFGGLPAMEDGESWPVCDGCADDLRFVAQVNNERDGLHDRLPIAFFTFFYCWNCHPWGRSGERGGWLVRSYTSLTDPHVADAGDGPAFEERHALPLPGKSLPDGCGMSLHCPELWDLVPGDSGGRDAWANWRVVDSASLDLTHERVRAPHLRNAGVAIGGYPYWANGGDQTPFCPDCPDPMELLLQIRPTELTDASWGDVGTLYLFMCREHTQRTGLRIQCT
ncbi:DUF1963 domain-containing protein [Phytomonospora endophytica]|uniref:Uncharacterized protein YwqG n=1 Tax=Phytomonospora endophytica TaxID=714109 RepID=A0A841FKE5_9ACTN|nr:DUF1963 domain-containing protein [Phytomonospora endophytica]MBB6033627.1 uncharacterized protein YwqG [Phytomonospora endophytica]GIG64857.1 hypothetical protein Pen01_11520 [Phytomonospora endophytica]